MKVKKFRIPQSIMLFLMNKVAKFINLPKDVKVHHAYHDSGSNSFFLVIESNEFKDLPEPQDGDFYEGWVVRSKPFNFISTGKATLENNEYINRFVSDEDWLDHSLYVLTLADKKWRDANKKNI